MAVDKKFFVDINLQGNALNNATIGSNSDMTKGGSFRFDGERLEYYDGSSVQSVANLADISAVTGGLILQGGYDAATNTPDIADGTAKKGYFWVVTEAGSFLGDSVQVGDSIIAKVDNAGASIGDWLILQGNVVIATDSVDGIVRLATQAEVNDGTEGGAVVVTPATLQSKIDTQITPTIDSKLPLSGGMMSGGIDMAGNYIGHVLLTDTSLGSNLNADNNAIINLPTPINGGDAANKQYVDDQAAAAQSAAEATASADATAKADAAEAAAKSYADGLAPNYDAAGSAAQALTDANSYTDSAISQEVTNRNSAIATAKSEAISAGKSYTDGAIAQEVIDRDAAIATAKSEAIADANTYTNTQITAQTTVKFVDTTAWVLSGDFYYAEVLHTLGSYVNFTTTMNAGQVVEFAATMGNDNIVLFSNTVPSSPVLVLLSKVNSNS